MLTTKFQVGIAMGREVRSWVPHPFYEAGKTRIGHKNEATWKNFVFPNETLTTLMR